MKKYKLLNNELLSIDEGYLVVKNIDIFSVGSIELVPNSIEIMSIVFNSFG